MKHYLIIFFCLVALISGCTKETDTVFSETPDQRLEKTLTEFETKLIGGQYGWIGVLEPKSGTPYYFYFIFKPGNRTSMLADFNLNTATVLKESSYRLKALQQPTLIFDTYSYIHMLADPDPAVMRGTAGKGFYSDFEFAYDPTIAKADTITLFGRFNGAKLTMVRATKEQGDNFLSGGLAKAFDFHKISALKDYTFTGNLRSWNVGGEIFNYWKRFTIGGTTYEVDEGSFDPLSKTITFSWYTGNQKNSFTTPYHFAAGAVILDKPFTAGSTVVTQFTNITWNDTNKSLTVNINGSPTTTTFAGATAPLKYDTTTFTSFRNEGLTSYWISDYGFQNNGVYNKFGLDTLTVNNAAGKNTFYFAVYFPQYGANYDLFAPIYLNPAQTGITLFYGYAAVNNNPASPIVKDGIANFNFGGTIGSGMPSTGGWGGTLSLFRANTGYYFVKLPGGGYDQISVSDSKSWISWYH